MVAADVVTWDDVPPSTLILLGWLAAQPGRPVPIDNQYVRVVDALDPPHARGPLHEHKTDRVMVYLTKCDTRLTDASGRVERQHWKPGDVAWSPARGPHTSENPNDAPCRIVEIELKPGSGRKPVPAGPLDPVAVDPGHYKVEFENQQVRVLRARYGPKETGAVHEHTRDRVTVFLTPAELRAASPDGTVEIIRRNASDVGWGTVSRHSEVNLRDAVFEVIAVELKAR